MQLWLREKGNLPRQYITSYYVLLTLLQGLMKGYISREHAMVVLNKKGAFPGTGV